MNSLDFLWQLPRGRVLRLSPAVMERRIAVLRGRLWLTRDGDPADHWLQPGQGLTLRPHESAVLEAWPSAEFQVLLPRALAPLRRFAPLCWALPA